MTRSGLKHEITLRLDEHRTVNRANEYLHHPSYRREIYSISNEQTSADTYTTTNDGVDQECTEFCSLSFWIIYCRRLDVIP